MGASLKAGQPITLTLGPRQRTFRRRRVGSEAPLPSAGTMARSLSEAFVATVRAVLTGDRVVATPEEAERRKAICVTNRCGMYRASDDRCAACGCWKKAKVWVDAVRCPKSYW